MARSDLTGEAEVLRNLNREIRKIKGRTVKGTLKAGLLIKRRSQDEVPVDTSNLKDGAYVETISQTPEIIVEVGYVAFYAVYVHERLELRHKVGKAKFLEDPLKISTGDVLRIIAENARIR